MNTLFRKKKKKQPENIFAYFLFEICHFRHSFLMRNFKMRIKGDGNQAIVCIFQNLFFYYFFWYSTSVNKRKTFWNSKDCQISSLCLHLPTYLRVCLCNKAIMVSREERMVNVPQHSGSSPPPCLEAAPPNTRFSTAPGEISNIFAIHHHLYLQYISTFCSSPWWVSLW